jgi:hypothetical protein
VMVMDAERWPKPKGAKATAKVQVALTT